MIRFSYIILFVLLIGGCKKDVNTSGTGSNGFIKEFNFLSQNSGASYLEQTSDHNLLVIGREGNSPGNLFIMKVDLHGNLLWHKSILKDTFSVDYIRSLGDGTYLSSDYNWFSLIDSSGNYLWNVNNGSVPGTYSGSDAVFSNGKYYQGFSNGSASASPTNSFVYAYDKNHNLLGGYSFPDSGFYHGHTIWLNVLGANPDGTLKILGQKYCSPNWNWTDPWKMFFGKTSGIYLKDTVSVGDRQIRYTDNPVNFITTPDQGFVVFGTRTDFATNLASIFIFVLDNNLTLKAQYSFSYNGFATLPHNVSLCHDGGYLISGYYVNTLSNQNDNGYLLRIDKNGNKLWDKTFSTSGSSIFYSAVELNDGSIAVAGTSNSFGKGKNGADILIVKMDANGNLQ